MTGKELQKAAVSLARMKGYRVAHFPTIQDYRGVWRTPIAADGRGWPDLILVGRKMLAVEVKGDGDSLRVEQKAWLAAFENAGVETLVLTSKGWKNGELDALL